MIKVYSREKFSEEVEGLVSSCSELTYLEAIMIRREALGLDIEDIPRLITPKIKQKLKNQSEELNMIKEELPKLPIDD